MKIISAGLLLLLLSGLRADNKKIEVRAMVGSTVDLSCIYPEENSFKLNELFVYWQIDINGEPKSVAYYLSGNSSVGHDEYKDRAQMSLDSMKQGDFSLHLYNITPQDEQEFNCLVFRNLTKIWHVVVMLHVAANYSMPVVIAPSNASQDEELTFTCMSKDGYPRPNVYWINRTDNSLLDEALQNSTATLNARGLYDVVSVLRIRWTPNVNVGCCIENVLLHQNLTVSSQTGALKEDEGSNPDIPGGDTYALRNRVVVAVLAVLIVAVAIAVGWACRGQCPHWSYAGAQASRSELELTGQPLLGGG
ncbi:ICOS ligand isoform X2 [Saccopteryx leptura]|uniref:ICOS ligand isoform X2 n=1 Tax=Saccopteryx leptura TaxID=249018 RepID=UPI00339CDCE1